LTGKWGLRNHRAGDGAVHQFDGSLPEPALVFRVGFLDGILLPNNVFLEPIMAISRPLTKDLLKKLYLKTLYEHRPKGGKWSGHGWSVRAVIDKIPLLFPELDRLSEQEKKLAHRGVFELEHDGFIEQDPTQSSEHKILSDRGKKVVQETPESMQLPSIDIDQLLSRDDLRGRVRDDFISGKYEAAVFNAFKCLEESVRAKTGEPASSYGLPLMDTAFSESKGKLRHPGAAVPNEQAGLHQLMRGAIAWFKNPSSHRTVVRDDAQQAAHMLAFANLLLDLLDECVNR
jgi:uncharacterized protein (TIGR02391 family)